MAVLTWRNSLGMTFAKVPLVSREQPNESSAKSLFFAEEETSNKHVATFFAETGRTDTYHRNASKPACQISWSEAVAFCDWLTLKERTNGILRNDQSYRLPTDHEWSCAVGIGNLESVQDEPELKGQSLKGIYPWGITWPPPKGAGNLAGMESRSVFPENYIVGFSDRYRGRQVAHRASKPNAIQTWKYAESTLTQPSP